MSDEVDTAIAGIALANIQRAELAEARLAAAERVVEAAREDASGPCTQYRGRCATCNYDYLPCRRDELRSALVAYDTLKEQVK